MVQIANISTFEDTARFTSLRTLHTDIHDMCALFGPVLEIKIPRPQWVEGRQRANEEKDRLKEEEEKKMAEEM